ncbi:MAG: type IV pilus modification PilV family protein [Candidatus Nitrospinota bacterium M3_3B_026]
MTWKGRKLDGKGFTLLEIMVSLTILSIALVTLLAAQNRALIMNAEARTLTDAVTLAREEMERLHIEPLPEPGVSDSKKRDDYPAFEWRTEITQTPFENVWEARLHVYYAGEEEGRSLFSLRTYVEREREERL